jgi:hypothetical protein
MSPIRRFRNRVLVGLTERAWLFPLVQHLRGKSAGTFCDASTDLCVEGFESNANSFMVNVFRRLRSDLQVAHHTHSVANLKRSRQYDVPTVILFHDPVDAIPSLVSWFRPGLHEAVLRYIRFYRDVCGHTSKVFFGRLRGGHVRLRTVPSFQRTTELFRTLHQARRRQNEALK